MSILPRAREYNWAQFILDFFLEGIKDYQKRTRGAEKLGRNIGICGCTFFLKIFFLQQMDPLAVESGMPIFLAWTNEKIRLASNKKLKKKARGPPGIDIFEDRLDALDQAFLHEPSASTSSLRFQDRLRKLEVVVFGFQDRLRKLEVAVFDSHWSTHQAILHEPSASTSTVHETKEHSFEDRLRKLEVAIFNSHYFEDRLRKLEVAIFDSHRSTDDGQMSLNFGKNWFDAQDACALKEAVKPSILEELNRFLQKNNAKRKHNESISHIETEERHYDDHTEKKRQHRREMDEEDSSLRQPISHTEQNSHIIEPEGLANPPESPVKSKRLLEELQREKEAAKSEILRLERELAEKPRLEMEIQELKEKLPRTRILNIPVSAQGLS